MNFDIAVIGAGPSGIQAAIHATRAKVSVVVLGKSINSALHGTKIENYFGVGDADGSQMLSESIEHAKNFGAEFIEENVISTKKSDNGFVLVTEDGKEIESKAVIFATGISRKKLNIPGETEFFGKGVSYCASCDCNFYKGKVVIIIGNDTEAALSAELMTKYASKTYWITDKIKASANVVDRVKLVGVSMINGKIKSIAGTDKVTSVMLENDVSLDTDGVFIELGAKSSADLVLDLDIMPEIDDTIKVNDQCETIIKGIYACGDVTGKPWQIAKAVGEGCIAGTNAAKYVKG